MKVMANELKEVLDVFMTAPSAGGAEGKISNVFFSEGKIEFFKGETYFRKELKSDFSAGVDFEFLSKIVAKYGTDEIELSRNEDCMVIKKGKSVSKIPCTEESSIPRFEFDEVEWKKVPTDLPILMDSVYNNCEDSAGEISKGCIHISGRYVEASDGLHMGIFKMKGNFKDEFFLKKEFCRVLNKFEPVNYFQDGTWIFFKNEKEMKLAIRNISIPEYPDLMEIYNSTVDGNKVVFPDSIINALERSEIFLQSETKIDKFVSIDCKNERIHIHSETKSGKYSDYVDGEGCDDFSIKVNPSYLLDMLLYSNEIVISENSISCESRKAKLCAVTVQE